MTRFSTLTLNTFRVKMEVSRANIHFLRDTEVARELYWRNIDTVGSSLERKKRLSDAIRDRIPINKSKTEEVHLERELHDCSIVWTEFKDKYTNSTDDQLDLERYELLVRLAHLNRRIGYLKLPNESSPELIHTLSVLRLAVRMVDNSLLFRFKKRQFSLS